MPSGPGKDRRSLGGYDLLREAELVRDQLQSSPDPVVQARHLVSQSILAQVLLALADAGFYEYVSAHPSFSEPAAIEALGLDPFTFKSVYEHLIGCGLLERVSDGQMRLTDSGRRYFNAYTRGVLNIYLGGYKQILSHLGSVLKKELSLADKALARSTWHAAAGTAQATCAFTIPEVFEVIRRHRARCCLDLGCGTGDFLISFARLHPGSEGVGVDLSSAALSQARETAKLFGVDERLLFHEATIGRGSLELPKEQLERIDIVTAMYMLHEFGRDGRGAVIDVLRSLREQLPGRVLLVLEVEACDPEALARQRPPPAHFGRLDYRLIHLLSGQGLPRSPADWNEIFSESGCEVIEPGIPTGGSLIYGVRL